MGFPKHKKIRCFIILLLFSLWGINMKASSPDNSDPLHTVADSSSTSSNSVIENTPSHLRSAKLYHVGIDYRPEYVLQTNDFLKGNYENGVAVKNSQAYHLRYSFSYAHNTLSNLVYRNAYQGVGLISQTFDNSRNLGNPTSFYLFQGAELAKLSQRLTLNYEWNFGLSFGWTPYNYYTNPNNTSIGSRLDAFMNLNFYLRYKLSTYFDAIVGASVSHFSNGNTKYPNNGLNTTGLRLGVVYNFNSDYLRNDKDLAYKPRIPQYPKHISYDYIMFASWRRKGVLVGDEWVASPDAYLVSGFNFAPMYNFGYNFRAGVSLDGVYDQSANIYVVSSMQNQNQQTVSFQQATFDKQVSLGMSARTELVMPYFCVNIGLGANFWGKGDQRGTYQVLALKIEVLKSSYIHIGYNLKDFHTPNYLMLGIGYRFHDKSPTIYRK